MRDSDDIRHTVDYDQVVDRLEALLASRHFHLLEHLSQAVLDTLGDSFPVKRAEVTLAKPLAVPKARRVSVTRPMIAKSRPHFSKIACASASRRATSTCGRTAWCDA